MQALARSDAKDLTNVPEVSKYIKEMQRRKELAAEELQMVKQTEHHLQGQKEALLLVRKEHDGEIEGRQRIINAAREKIPDIQGKKRFDEVFGVVDSCYHLQLLIIELQEQLTLAKALCEEEACNDLLKGLAELQDVPEDIDPSGVLCSWYHQMKKHVQNRSSQLHCSADEDCFVNVRLSSVHGGGFVTCPNLVPKLSFGIKYKGYCLHLSIEETRSSSYPLSTPQYAITSDIHLQGLEVKGREYLERGQTAKDFILQVVWPIMEENICV